jgi:hypothetical protein
MKLAFAFALLVVTGSCHYGITDIPSVPDHPTYRADVYPVLSDHCLLCHGAAPNRGAPAYFRLDVYDDVGTTLGAQSMAAAIAGDVASGRMPPASPGGDGVGPNGIAMLQKWVDQGALP